MANIYTGYDIDVLQKLQSCHIDVLLGELQYDINVLPARHRRVENILRTHTSTNVIASSWLFNSYYEKPKPVHIKSIGYQRKISKKWQ